MAPKQKQPSSIPRNSSNDHDIEQPIHVDSKSRYGSVQENQSALDENGHPIVAKPGCCAIHVWTLHVKKCLLVFSLDLGDLHNFRIEVFKSEQN